MARRTRYEAGLAESCDVAQKKLKRAVMQLTGCSAKDAAVADDLVLPGATQTAQPPLALTLVCQEQSAMMQSVLMEAGVFDDMSAEQKKATVHENRKKMNDFQKNSIKEYWEGYYAVLDEDKRARSS